MLMSEIEIITDGGRRRRWSAADKRRILEKNMYDGESIAVAADDSITGNKAVRDMEARIRERERQRGRKTMEVEIRKDAPDTSRAKKSRAKNGLCLRSR
jgi:transposase